MTATATKQLIKSPAVGMGRLSWLCADGEQVEQGQPVARFTVGSVAHTVTATITGRLTIVSKIADTVTMQGGNPIGSIDPNAQGSKPLKASKTVPTESTRNYPQSSSAARVAPINAPQSQIQATTPTPTTDTPLETPYNAPQRAVEGNKRRGFDVPTVEPVLTVLDSGAAAVNPSKRQPKKRTKTAHTTYHITEQQAAALIDLSTNFRKDPDTPSYSASEIVRAAVEHLLNQDRPTVEAILSHNRNREKRGGYGAGWRKPNQKQRGY